MDAPFEEGLWVGVLWVLLGLDQQVRHVLSYRWIWEGRKEGWRLFRKMPQKKKTQKEGKEPFKSRNKEQTGLGASGCFP